MQVTHNLTFDGRSPSSKYKCQIDEPNICPLCKHAIKPQTLGIFDFKDEAGNYFASALFLCKHCYQTFVSLYSCKFSSASSFVTSKLLYTEPNQYVAKVFDERIVDLSPKFKKVYNQALAAETCGLDELSGMGYRKALEFLIKDYLIHENPDEAEIIRKMELGNCIANKVSNERLKTVASRSAWLGNDQTHYTQRFENKDISDLKNFIDATVYWVSMELITEEALSITKQGQP